MPFLLLRTSQGAIHLTVPTVGQRGLVVPHDPRGFPRAHRARSINTTVTLQVCCGTCGNEVASNYSDGAVVISNSTNSYN